MLAKKFEDQVIRTPNNIAVKTQEESFTYEELNRYANSIARLISETTAKETVGLLFEHGAHMIAAILGALKAGKVYVPLSVDYPDHRLAYMLGNSESSLIITSPQYQADAQRCQEEIDIPILTIPPRQILPGSGQNPEREIRTTQNAYILYTSGSTGNPKGVVQTHKNIDYFNRNWIRIFNLTANDRMALFSSFCHDASVQDMYSALQIGATLYTFDIKSRQSLLQLPQLLKDETITFYHSVPSLFSYFAGLLTGEAQNTVNTRKPQFPHLRFILLGGEAVRQHEVDLFKKHFPQAHLANVYGQTESSANAICLIPGDGRYKKPLIGEPLDETEIFVVDDEGCPVETMESGEILVGCPYISPGYWKNPQLTESVFDDDEEFGRLYWTGDLGCLLPDGNIEFLGRRDYQVKIRGFRVEMGEIETQLLKHPQIKEAIVVARDDDSGDKYLTAYLVILQQAHHEGVPLMSGSAGQEETRLDVPLLRDFLAREVPDYMIPTFYVHLDKMPLTVSNKIDRKALPMPDILETGDPFAPPRDHVDKELAQIWSDVLGLNEEQIGIDNDFFSLGGHSLRANIITSKMQQAFDVRVPLATIFNTPTIRGLADYVNDCKAEGAPQTADLYAAVQPVEKKEYYPVSRGQQRFYILQQMTPDSTGYNLAQVIHPGEKIEKEKLEETFKQLIRRHEGLRTSFFMKGDQLVQKIHEEVPFQLDYYPRQANPIEVIKSVVRAFDLSRPPLLRAALIETTDNRQLLVTDIHHMLSDGASQQILALDFNRLLSRQPLPALTLQYKDFCQWQDHMIASGRMKEHEDFWLEHLKSPLPALNLPTDFPRPQQQTFTGATFTIPLEKSLTRDLAAFTAQTGTTLYMLLLAAFNILLSRYTGLEDIIIGSPMAGRDHADLQNIIGLIMQSIMVRTFPKNEKTVSQFLEEIKQTTLEIYEHQVYPYEELIQKLDTQQETSWNAITSVALNIQNMLVPRTASTGGDDTTGQDQSDQSDQIQADQKQSDQNQERETYVPTTSKLDLTITAWEWEGEISLMFEYCKDLFKAETMERLSRRFIAILEKVLKNPALPLAEIDMICDDEKEALMETPLPLHPLSHAQKRIYYTETLNPGTSCNNLAFTFKYKEALDHRLLEQAVNYVLKTNDGLRLRFAHFDNVHEPNQYIAPYEPYHLEAFDFSHSEPQRHQWLDKQTTTPFSLHHTPLYYFAIHKISPGQEKNVPSSGDEGNQINQIPHPKPEAHSGSVSHTHPVSPKAARIGGPGGALPPPAWRAPWPAGRPLGEPPEANNHTSDTNTNVCTGLYMKLHHLICDGWTVFLVIERITAAYEALEKGEVLDQPQPPSYLRYLRDEREYLRSPHAEEDRRFWHQTLLPLPEETQLWEGFQLKGNIGAQMAVLPFPHSLRQQMHSYCQAQATRTSLFKLILSALSLYISRYSGNDSVDAVIGSASHNRTTSEQKKMTGMFVSTLPLRITADAGTSFQDFVRQTGSQTNFILKNHQLYPYDRLAAQLREETRIDAGYLLNINLIGHPDFKEDNYTMEHHFPGVEPTPLSIHINGNNRDIHGVLELEWDYQSPLFSAHEIQRMHQCLIDILQNALASPEKPLSRISLASQAQQEEILSHFSRSADDTAHFKYASEALLHDLIRNRAARNPQAVAVVGPRLTAAEGEPPNNTQFPLTYGELDREAQHLASILNEKGVGPGTIVGIMVPPSQEMIIGLLGILKSGGAYLPIDPAYPDARIRYMLEDSATPLLLTHGTAGENLVDSQTHCEIIPLHQLPPSNEPSPRISSQEQPGFENSAENLADNFTDNLADNLAYIIYTSGSTGRPKAVAVQHRNLTAYLNAFENEFTIEPTDTMIQQASFAFDAFVEEFYPLLLNGGKLAVPPREDVLDIQRLAQFIHRHQVTLITCSPLLLNQLNRLAGESSEGKELLKSIRLYISGGDRLLREYIDNLLETAQVYNTYGPTETTVCATYYRCRPDSPNNAPIGRPIAGYSAYILDKFNNLLPAGLKGELCITGPGVTPGYLNRPQLTAQAFPPCPAPLHLSPHTSAFPPIYHTGDSARWLPDGEIQFCGRIDSQVSIRGFRIEPGEIQERLQTHELVKDVVVIDHETQSGDPYLCAYMTLAADVPFDRKVFRDYLSQDLPNYMIPSFFVPIDKIPLTPSGKVDRRALPDPQTRISQAHKAPVSQIEKKLAAIWAAVLETPVEKISIHADFFQMGGHSLKSVSLVNAVHKVFDVKIDITTVFKVPTIARMAAYIRGREQSIFTRIQPAPLQSDYPLSYSQRRIWLLQRLTPDSGVFNMPGSAFLGETADPQIIRRVVFQLVCRHESFRTFFKEAEEEVVQVVQPAPPSSTALSTNVPGSLLGNIQIIDISTVDESLREARFKELIQQESETAFDLSQPPLFRVKLVKTGWSGHDKGDAIIFNMHHIISDGWSLDILHRDFRLLYTAAKEGKAQIKAPIKDVSSAALQPLRIGYKDYAVWHNRLLEDSEGMARAVQFWKTQLSHDLPVLNLPYDFGVTKTDDKRSAGFQVVIPHDIAQKLEAIASENAASLFMVLLGGLHLLLYSLRSQEEIVIGIPGAARLHEDLKDVIGLFVNTLILSNRVQPGEMFPLFLERLRDNTFNVLEYQGYPMELMCEKAGVKYPQLNVFFNMLNIGKFAEAQLTNFQSAPVEAVQDTKFDLTFYVAKYANGIQITCNYFQSLFKPLTIQKLMEIFKRILTNIAANPNQPLSAFHKTAKKRKLKRGG